MTVKRERVYCELCGTLVTERPSKAMVEGVLLTLCARCYQRVVSGSRDDSRRHVISSAGKQAAISRATHGTPAQNPRATQRGATSTRLTAVRRYMESYDVVEDYAERIRRARERLGWTPATLALKVREKENVIRRIESGRLKPTIDLALRLESVLRVKLLEPIVDEEPLRSVTEAKGFELTLGDIANVRKKAR